MCSYGEGQKSYPHKRNLLRLMEKSIDFNRQGLILTTKTVSIPLQREHSEFSVQWKLK